MARELGLEAAAEFDEPDTAPATISATSSALYIWTEFCRLVFVQNDFESGTYIYLKINAATAAADSRDITLGPGGVFDGIRGLMIKQIAIYNPSAATITLNTDYHIHGCT